MIQWSVAAPALKSLLEGLAHTAEQKARIQPAFKARWAGKKTGFINPKAKAELILKLRQVEKIGDDETRIENIADEGDPADPRESIVGQRRITIEVRCESFRHGEENDTWAWTMAGLISTRLRRKSSSDALTAVNLALIDLGPAIDISYEFNEREVNAASFELILVGAFRDVDIDTPYEWFERALVTSHLEHTDGTELPSPPNYTDEPMGQP